MSDRPAPDDVGAIVGRLLARFDEQDKRHARIDDLITQILDHLAGRLDRIERGLPL
jgi:hypothetical protein